MATLKEDHTIEFTKEDIESAWNNAPKLINKDENEMRLCFICKFHMIKENFNNTEYGYFGWIIELVDLKKMSLEQKNFIAIHPFCRDYRPKQNCSKILKKVNYLLWKFNEEEYES
ncbi:hypothetical protein [Spiroplasma apis]|uniref:Uncharacterized protein n=1 Tax=Spiroplasma apis B31 TaxID=1276258 RepID=V5RJX2_SPIAP|nr:hypothetical protein [Spiroplasma apis]AHB36080.1 hypothetical protein SAPIS_v1c02340 [Spiroplasma apis B31]